MAHAGELELLILLAVQRLEGEAYGVTVLEELERETSRSLTLGSVYKTLGRLEGKGLLTSSVAPPTQARGGRRKKIYELTPAGLEAVRSTLTDLRRLARGLEPEVEAP
jgi:DNA-binding PadR family transcriptional regulator